MSIYISCTKSGSKKYLQIVEATYVKRPDGSSTIKRKTLKGLGAFEKFDDGKPDFLKRFREKFKNGELEIEGIEEFVEKKQSYESLGSDEYAFLDPKNIGYFFFYSIFNHLGIDEILTLEKSRSGIKFDVLGLTRLLVLGRLQAPESKIATFYQKDKYIFPITTSVNEKEIYAALDVLNDCCEKIQNRMHLRISQSSIGRDTDLMYYDVTNYYFEIMYNDEDRYIIDENGNKIVIEKSLRKKGVSKEHKPQPIVQMGLFIDQNGIPVSFDLFPGNTQDKTTFRDMIRSKMHKRDSEKNNSGKVIVVADNGMYAQENFYLLLEQGNGFIIAKSIKRSWKKCRELALSNDGYTYIYDSFGTVTFKYKSIIEERIFKDKNGHSKTAKVKQIIYWSKKQYEKTKKENEKFIEYLKSCKEHPDKLKDKQRKSQEFLKKVQVDKKTGEVLNTKEVLIFLDDKIKEQQEMMGYYSIETSEYNLDDREVINRYHGLSRIEDSFRVIKSDLDGRPIYVRTKEHIRAHFLICFIALTIIRIWQYKVLKFQDKETLNVDGWESGITAKRLVKSINGFNADRISDERYKVSKPDEVISMLLEIVSSKRDLCFPTEHIIRQLKSDICKSKL